MAILSRGLERGETIVVTTVSRWGSYQIKLPPFNTSDTLVTGMDETTLPPPILAGTDLTVLTGRLGEK